MVNQMLDNKEEMSEEFLEKVGNLPAFYRNKFLKKIRKNDSQF
jgi:hypothetical protein